jgi:hypothetical protein
VIIVDLHSAMVAQFGALRNLLPTAVRDSLSARRRAFDAPVPHRGLPSAVFLGACSRAILKDMDIVILKNIAADAAYILGTNLNDRRRSAPFERLAERSDPGMAADLRTSLVRASQSLVAKHPMVAEQIDELLDRLERAVR